MLGSDFRGLAEAVTQTYGDDPWFFLRELAQNSRDAGAHHIRVNAETSPAGTETITFEDDGRGMTLAHARRFLFRLFASDKGGDPAAAGRYGIGFWTILRFRPEAILLQSRHGDGSWAISLDAGLNARSVPCLLNHSGTMIALTRPAVFSSPGEFARQVESGLLTYCRYLRRNDRRGTMLPLWFAGRNLTEPMALPNPMNVSFRSGPVEGAVGLGEKPEVRLFARGLPVWQGAVLGQMSHLQTDADIRAEVGGGLAPVFLLNGNHLDVTFARHLAVENRALDLVRQKAESALRRLLETSLEATFPRKWPQRLRDRLQAELARLRRPGWRWIVPVLLLLVPLEIVILRQWFPAAGGGPSWFSLRAAPASYRGAVVGRPASASPPPFSYSPQEPRLFRLFVADNYDVGSGFLRQAGAKRRPLPPVLRCPPSTALSMRLRAEGGAIFLPLAAGQELLPGSLRLNGRTLSSAYATVQGETVALLPAQGGGRVEYRSCPELRQPELAASDRSRFLALPSGVALPAELEAAVSASRSAPVAERAALALGLAREKLAYDTSLAAMESYRRSSSENSWLTRVLRIGRGDCDVLNGFQVLLLRKMGVPARLVIGMVGEAGRARPRLHAWGEYFDHGWESSDATTATVNALPPPAVERFPPPDPGPGLPPAARAAPFISRFHPGAVWLVLLPVLAGAALLFLARRRRRDGATILPPAFEMKKPLLQIALQAQLQPEFWGADNPLQRHRLLPTVNGHCVSLRQVQRLQRQKKLFVTANRNPLALALAAGRLTVLDLSLPLYSPWRTLFAGAVDCDLLCRLRPEPPAAGDSLLAAVNAMLRSRRRRALAVLLAPGLSDMEFLRISLPAPLKNSPFFFPRRFIAVAPEGKAFRRAAELYAVNPPLAVLRFLRRLHDDGIMENASATRQLKKAARRLLRSSHG